MTTSPLTRTTMDDVLIRARFEAVELHHELKEPGHVFLALLTGPQHHAGHVLNAFGVSSDTARPIVAALYPRFEGDHFIDAFNTTSLDVIDKSKRLARTPHMSSDQWVPVKAHHVLMALIGSNSPDPVVMTALKKLSVNPKDILRSLDMELVESKN